MGQMNRSGGHMDKHDELEEYQQHFVIGSPKSQICWSFLKVSGSIWVRRLSHYSLFQLPKGIF